MMKNLRKNALISLVIVLATVLLLARGVNASGDLLATPGGNTATTNTANVLRDNTTNTTNTATNVASVNNVQKVNNINDASKDIPQTGENDIYVITVIGLAAVVIGGIAFAKSKKYDI